MVGEYRLAVHGDDDPLQGDFHQCAVAFLAFPQGPLRFDALGDIGNGQLHGRSVVPTHPACYDLDPNLPAVLTHGAVRDALRVTAPRDHLAECFQHTRAVLLVKQCG